jgi:hypothetical protein
LPAMAGFDDDLRFAHVGVLGRVPQRSTT